MSQYPTKTIIFFRGLKTWGGDDLPGGLFLSRPIWEPLQLEWQKRGYQFYPVEDMGWGTRSDVCMRTRSQLSQLILKHKIDSFHILAHSTGGLIAREILQSSEFAGKVNSLVTMATPHQGTPLADLVLQIQQHRPALFKWAQLVGYDVEVRQRAFSDLTPLAVEEFNQDFDLMTDWIPASLSYSVSPQKLSWPLKGINRLFPDFLKWEHDGIVPKASQHWGRHLGHFHLDHLQEIGWAAPPRSRLNSRIFKEFQKSMDVIEELFDELNSKN